MIKSPKLYFLDTGLLCYLLRIRSAEELVTHAARGPIFETWVLSEILKHRLNRGEHAGLYFYRDRKGLEADIVIEEGRNLTVVEAKAGQTCTPEVADAGRQVAEALTGAGQTRRVVVLGGEAGQKRTDVEILSWDSLDRWRW